MRPADDDPASIIRPSNANSKRFVASVSPFFLLPALAIGIGVAGVNRVAGVVTLIVLLGGALILLRRAVRGQSRMSVALSGAAIVSTAAMGSKPTSIPLSAIDKALLVRKAIRPRLAPAPALFLLGADGSCIFRLFAGVYSEGDLEQIAAMTSRPVERIDQANVTDIVSKKVG